MLPCSEPAKKHRHRTCPSAAPAVRTQRLAYPAFRPRRPFRARTSNNLGKTQPGRPGLQTSSPSSSQSITGSLSAC